MGVLNLNGYLEMAILAERISRAMRRLCLMAGARHE